MTHSGSGSRILSSNGGRLNSDTGSRLPNMNESIPIPEILTSGPTNGREGAEVSHKQEGEINKIGSSQQRGNINTRSASRRRALIQAFSDEDEEDQFFLR